MSTQPVTKELGVPNPSHSAGLKETPKIFTTLPSNKASKGSYDKVTVVREKTKEVSAECRTGLGISSDEISELSPSVDAFFDGIAVERLRRMPPDGSKLDIAFRWASRLALTVNSLREAVGGFALYADEAAMLIWGSCLFLLQVRSYFPISFIGLLIATADGNWKR